MRKSLPFTLIWGAPVVAILITLLGGLHGSDVNAERKGHYGATAGDDKDGAECLSAGNLAPV